MAAAVAAPELRCVGFVGAGRMAEAIAQGLIRAGKVEAQHVLASAPSDRNLCHFREGAMVMARGRHAGRNDAELLQTLLEACGQCEEVPEAQVDIHTGLSGSGVAFVCAFSEALAEGAIKMGMPSGLAHRIAAQTLLGTAKMLLQKGQHPAQLRTDVCTPGGTTIYGLHALEQGGLRAAAMSAVEAATCRAKELSRK
ncbi:pyrroline-5-carboxylate reductase 3 [Rhinolophus ferrumequinum]|uniref:Pyrroline-5-carboxylate reductase 3 n=1 Tax=Rhinolophus ferrumequinum TaxID=59479 RepID=A0A7J7R0Y7_RHIFE|nr:pyrroline-5-carboxylate reductase 3 [Rhinolophus ferrumequinum]